MLGLRLRVDVITLILFFYLSNNTYTHLYTLQMVKINKVPYFNFYCRCKIVKVNIFFWLFFFNFSNLLYARPYIIVCMTLAADFFYIILFDVEWCGNNFYLYVFALILDAGRRRMVTINNYNKKENNLKMNQSNNAILHNEQFMVFVVYWLIWNYLC